MGAAILEGAFVWNFSWSRHYLRRLVLTQTVYTTLNLKFKICAHL